ncbi:MAG: FAD-dependent oxidoreductase [Candidatus Margulisbacteria bacterium]|nr:FAD-dependent oxidoreductase [Candidatus Margulisiibacteriota bacterium]
MAQQVTDFLIIGAGIVGITTALSLKKTYPDAKIIILEKEPKLGCHASGRNSGVIHAGFYYSPDSLKAKMTRAGNIAMKAFCEENNIPMNCCGKLVVARNEDEKNTLNLLKERGDANGVPLELISATDAKKIEPRVKTFESALWSPTTASVDPTHVLSIIAQKATDLGVEIHYNSLGYKQYDAAYTINSAGLYADKIAQDFGFSKFYRILPFKGLYLYSDEPAGAINTHIYPVPNIKNPFLGVHFTLTTDNHLKIGPTAIPCLWREQYQGLDNFKFNELMEIGQRQLGLLFRGGFDFRSLAIEELKKYYRPHLVSQAAELLEGIHPSQYTRWGKPGIRAQLMNIETHTLEMDFVMEGDAKSLHILNAVSPAFTCAFPFADRIVERVGALIK